VSLSTRLVVMAERGRQMLQDIYQAPPAKIDLIAHGIPDVGFVDPTYFKDQFGVEGRVVLLTFGLLSPNKGIESVLNALPPILAQFPEVVYIVLGATHPNELREHGEAYRLSLEILAKKNRIEKNVIFYNQFVDLETLKEFIGAADLRRRQSGGVHAVLARGRTAGGGPRRAGAVRRRPGHSTRGDRPAARRHPPPRHSQERL
jgi:glycosyltransferase involved in cell wall biosynthesis